MARKKTVAVADVLEWANHFLEGSSDDMKELRKGIICMTEKILYETGNYKGFVYLASAKLVKGDLGLCVRIGDETRIRFIG